MDFWDYLFAGYKDSLVEGESPDFAKFFEFARNWLEKNPVVATGPSNGFFSVRLQDGTWLRLSKQRQMGGSGPVINMFGQGGYQPNPNMVAPVHNIFDPLEK